MAAYISKPIGTLWAFVTAKFMFSNEHEEAGLFHTSDPYLRFMTQQRQMV